MGSFLDGLVGSVIGVIGVVAMQILQGSIVDTRTLAISDPLKLEGPILSASRSAIAAVLYCVALAMLYRFASNKYTVILLVVAGAIAGQFLFIDVT